MPAIHPVPASASARSPAAWPSLISRWAKAADGRLHLVWPREPAAMRRTEPDWPTWTIR